MNKRVRTQPIAVQPNALSSNPATPSMKQNYWVSERLTFRFRPGAEMNRLLSYRSRVAALSEVAK